MRQDDARQLRQWIYGYQIAQAIHVAARLGIPDLLAREALDCGQLALKAGCNVDALRRLMRALETLGIFRLEGEDVYVHTDMSRLLIAEPDSQNFAACIYGDEHYRAWADLYECVKSGEERFLKLYGTGYFSYLDRQSEVPGKLQQYMEHEAAERSRVLLDAYDFSSKRHVVDVGGDGRFVSALLQRCPATRATLFGPEQYRFQGDADGRARYVAGDVRTTPPADADVYLLSQILHRFDDAEALAVLAGCRTAMARDAALLIQEYPLPDDGALAPGRWMDLNMMVVCGGRERTRGEYEALIRAAGLASVVRHQGAAGLEILECSLA